MAFPQSGEQWAAFRRQYSCRCALLSQAHCGWLDDGRIKVWAIRLQTDSVEVRHPWT